MDVTTTALLVIDVQEGFHLLERGSASRNNPQAEENIARLLGAFRAAGARVVHTRHASTSPDSPFRPGQPGYPVMPLAREQPGEPVIVKQVNSAFIGTPLEAHLRAAGITTVVICGATTNHCVETTTRMAGNLGFETFLVEDATWTFGRTGPDGTTYTAEQVQAMTMANLSGEFARIVVTGEVLARLTPSWSAPSTPVPHLPAR
ncbi:cysteine hydrolase family protein [Deinococcus apachensis]|uniref:cysteine hydrolase family protein n=1 Tax=Deinococcus apachensis TaxID=309886 RepID=UPI0006878003|nr:cysteine hydrolase family protein [Deinococcus apachensis]